MAAYQPDRGDFVYASFTPHAGHEQAGRRPALILSPLNFNIGTGLAFACPVTNTDQNGPFEVPVPPSAKLTGTRRMKPCWRYWDGSRQYWRSPSIHNPATRYPIFGSIVTV
jgi:hypothetical protein